MGIGNCDLRGIGIPELEDPDYQLLLGQIFVEGLDATFDFAIDLLRWGNAKPAHVEMIDEFLERHDL